MGKAQSQHTQGAPLRQVFGVLSSSVLTCETGVPAPACPEGLGPEDSPLLCLGPPRSSGQGESVGFREADR